MLDGQTEGTRDLSWIWKIPGIVENSKEGLQDSKWYFTSLDKEIHLNDYIGLRVEWCKARACADRWQEEVILLREEM